MVEFLIIAWILSGVWMFLRIMGKSDGKALPWQFVIMMYLFFLFWPVTFLLALLSDWYDWVEGNDFYIIPIILTMLREGTD